MADRNWSERGQFHVVGTTGTSAALTTPIIDLAADGGFESILFIGHQSASGSASNAGLKVQVGTATASLTDTTGDVLGNKTTLYLDVFRPVARYVRGSLGAGTATVAYRTLTAIPYGARKLPTTHPASTTGVAVYSPGTGTATG